MSVFEKCGVKIGVKMMTIYDILMNLRNWKNNKDKSNEKNKEAKNEEPVFITFICKKCTKIIRAIDYLDWHYCPLCSGTLEDAIVLEGKKDRIYN